MVLAFSLAALIISIANSLAISGNITIPVPGLRVSGPTAGADSATYGFETGPDGWTTRGSASDATSAATRFFSGQRSLQFHVSSLSSSNRAFVFTTNPVPVGQCCRVTAHLYVPPGAPSLFGTVYVLDRGYKWFSGPYPELVAGDWTPLLFDIPNQVQMPTHQVGVMVVGAKGQQPYTGTLFLDSVNLQHH
jgi:hypothetical protein